MTAPVGFDTLAFVKRLSAAGMEPPLAEALTEALADNAFPQLATKADVKELQADMREMELRLRGEIKDLKDHLTSRMGAMFAASTALTVAILGTLNALS